MNTPENSGNPEPDQPVEKPKIKRPNAGRAKQGPKKELTKEDLLNTPKYGPVKVHGRGKVGTRIKEEWPGVLRAVGNGYSLTEVCAVLNISYRTFQDYLTKFPDKKRELNKARYVIRDEMLDVILKAARKGNWIPAAWFLERVFPHTFAKPEVKLQMYDRMLNNDLVQQKIGGKSIDEIASELKTKFGEVESVQKFFSDAPVRSGTGSTGDNGDTSVSQPEPIDTNNSP